jgi:hypothetical protein
MENRVVFRERAKKSREFRVFGPGPGMVTDGPGKTKQAAAA